MEIDEPATVDDLVVATVVYGWTYSPRIADRTLLVPALGSHFWWTAANQSNGRAAKLQRLDAPLAALGNVPGRQDLRGGWCASDPSFSLCNLAASSHHPRLRALQQKGGFT